MSVEERALLDRLVEAQGLSIAEVLRRGLRLYAAEAGVTTSPAAEVAPAA